MIQINPYDALNCAELLLNLKCGIPNEVISLIITNETTSFKFIKRLLQGNKLCYPFEDFSLKAFDKISNNDVYMIETIKYLIKRNISLPEVFFNNTKKDVRLSYKYARILILNNKQIPSNIIQNFIGIEKYCKTLAKALKRYSNQEYINNFLKEYPELITYMM